MDRYVWQFRNGRLAAFKSFDDVQGVLAKWAHHEAYRAWDRSLGAWVFYAVPR